MRSTAAGRFLCGVLMWIAAAVPFARWAHAGVTDDARRLLEMSESDDLDRRADLCRTLLAERPTPFAQFFCEGYEMALLGRDREAELALANTLEQRPDFALAAILYGDLYAHQGKFDLAERYYRQAAEIQPQRIDARFLLGSVLLKRARTGGSDVLPEALEAFRQMTELDPASPDGWSNMGLVLTYMGRTREAEEMYRRAIERDPSDPLLYDNLGSLYARMDRNTEAEASWRYAIGLNPGYGAAVIELAALYARTERLADAITVLETGREAAQAPPWGPRIRRNLGYAYLRLDRMEPSRERFQQAVISGGDALAHLGLGHVRMLEGDTAGAVESFQTGCALDSVLARPFVQAWRATLKFALNPALQPDLLRVIEGLERGFETEGTPSDERAAAARAALPRDVSGPQATPHLVDFVLEGWSFADAEMVREELNASQADTLRSQYDSPPVPVKQVPAEYPESMQAAGMRGTVAVLVTVDEHGQVIDARLQSCDAPIPLCESALAAAEKWVFRPATRYGAPVRASVILPFRFVASGR